MSSVTEVEMIHELGYKYKVIFGEMGHRCGYVYIPRDYLLSDDMKFAISPDSDGLTIQELEYLSLMLNCYNDDFNTLKVHGGITFNEALEDVDINESEDFIYCLGFDCGHSGDMKDEECFKTYFPETSDTRRRFWFGDKYPMFNRGSIKTKLFCVQECLNLIKQLESMRSKK